MFTVEDMLYKTRQVWVQLQLCLTLTLEALYSATGQQITMIKVGGELGQTGFTTKDNKNM